IIFTEPERYEPWFHNEFTQLYSIVQANHEMQIIMYLSNDNNGYQPLQHFELSFKDFLIHEDIVLFFKMLINNGYYVKKFANVGLLSALHLERDFIHDILINGFDDESKTFYFRSYRNGHLQECAVRMRNWHKPIYRV
ncbi:MAG: hypothetical protein IKI50_06775, partial [Clostridia bacterium]|nr:hypothetical protein [Clostridia bacterium]